MPVRAAPGMSEKTIQKFLGQVSDRAGELTKKINHFDTLTNIFSDLFRLKKRFGTSKYQSTTHATGSRVYGMSDLNGYTATNDLISVKQSSGVIYFYSTDLPGWRNHTEKTDFPTSRSYFVEMRGENTYDTSINITSESAATGSTTTTVILTTNTSLAVNILQGAILTVDYGSGKVEKKVIIGNDADRVYISATDPLNSAPPNTQAVTIKSAGLNVYYGGGGIYGKFNPGRCVATISTTTMTDGWDRLDNVGVYSYASSGICLFGGRILSWSGPRVRWSDLANGDNFSKNAFLDFSGTVWLVKQFTDNIAIIYEKNRIWALVGTSPSSWELRLVSSNEGCNRPEVVANYISTGSTMQIFMNGRNQIKAITPEVINLTRDREVKTLTLSKNYVQESLDASANYLCAGCSPDGFYVIARSDDTYLVLNLEASERLEFDEWIWHNESRPTAQSPYVFAILSGYLVGGAAASGQMYSFHVPAVFSDDGTAISTVVTRRGLNFEQFGDVMKWYGLNISSGPSGGSTTVTVATKADNTPAGSISNALGTYNPSSGNKFRRFRIKNNPSLSEGTGKHIDFTLTESGTVELAAIEAIQLTYFPGIIR